MMAQWRGAAARLVHHARHQRAAQRVAQTHLAAAVGVLDASSYYESRQRHTQALVQMAATHIENGLLAKAGQFFGYPWKQGKTRITEHGYDKDPLPDNITDPHVYTVAHAADLGMVFYTGKSFPAKYQGGFFSAQHGSWNRTKPVGAQVISYKGPGVKAKAKGKA